MKGPQKDFTKLLRQIRRNGYIITMRGSGHYAISSPDGRMLVTLPASASDQRSIKNSMAVLRRNGVQYEPKKGKARRSQPKGGE